MFAQLLDWLMAGLIYQLSAVDFVSIQLHECNNASLPLGNSQAQEELCRTSGHGVLDDCTASVVIASQQPQTGELHDRSSEVLHGQSTSVFRVLQKSAGVRDAKDDVGAAAFVALLRECSKNKDLDTGTRLHHEILERGLLQRCSDALTTMYAQCGALTKAKELLEGHLRKNTYAWTALIAGYVQQDLNKEGLDCFEKMRHKGITPNAVTFSCALRACGALGAAEKGKQIHDEISNQGLLEKSIILATSLLNMYVKCGDLVNARLVLEQLPNRDSVSWNALITGYTQQDECEQALNCFELMQYDGIDPDVVTYSCVLKSCGTLGAALKGIEIHYEIVRHGLLGDNVVLGTALVDMYAKCGILAKAQLVLEELSFRDGVTWNALMGGYAQQGRAMEALNCFESMQHEGITATDVTFSCLLNACSHLGLIEDGHKCYASMITKFGLKPGLEIFTCMIDLFGRAGQLERAAEVILDMPSSDFVAVWHALSGACRKWGDVYVARWAYEQAVQIDRNDSGAYVLMADILADASLH